jgi:hypothetical protein
MTETEYCVVTAKTHLRTVQKLLSEAKSYSLNLKQDKLLTNAYNNVSQIIKSLEKQIKVEEKPKEPQS